MPTLPGASVSKPPATNASDLPSGDQSTAIAARFATRCRPRPLAPTTKMPGLPRYWVYCRVNAIERPSGDQLGEPSSTSPATRFGLVTRFGFLPEASATAMTADMSFTNAPALISGSRRPALTIAPRTERTARDTQHPTRPPTAQTPQAPRRTGAPDAPPTANVQPPYPEVIRAAADRRARNYRPRLAAFLDNGWQRAFKGDGNPMVACAFPRARLDSTQGPTKSAYGLTRKRLTVRQRGAASHSTMPWTPRAMTLHAAASRKGLPGFEPRSPPNIYAPYARPPPSHGHRSVPYSRRMENATPKVNETTRWTLYVLLGLCWVWLWDWAHSRSVGGSVGSSGTP